MPSEFQVIPMASRERGFEGIYLGELGAWHAHLTPSEIDEHIGKPNPDVPAFVAHKSEPLLRPWDEKDLECLESSGGDSGRHRHERSRRGRGRRRKFRNRIKWKARRTPRLKRAIAFGAGSRGSWAENARSQNLALNPPPMAKNLANDL